MNDEVALGLRGDGHYVERVREALSARTSDPEIWAYACRVERIVLTCNGVDFLALANAAIARAESFPGLVIVRQRGKRHSELPRVRALFLKAGEVGLCGNINYA